MMYRGEWSKFFVGGRKPLRCVLKFFGRASCPCLKFTGVLLAAYLQGLYTEGTAATQLVVGKLRTAIVQAWWGPSLHPHNFMRSSAVTLGFLAPLHRFDLHIIQCYSVLVALASSQRSAGKGFLADLFRPRGRIIGFAKLIHRPLQSLIRMGMARLGSTRFRADCSIRHLDFACKDAVGQIARHVLGDELRTWWWQHWRTIA